MSSATPARRRSRWPTCESCRASSWRAGPGALSIENTALGDVFEIRAIGSPEILSARSPVPEASSPRSERPIPTPA